MNGIWVFFLVCFSATAFVAVGAMFLRGLGYAVGPEDGAE